MLTDIICISLVIMVVCLEILNRTRQKTYHNLIKSHSEMIRMNKKSAVKLRKLTEMCDVVQEQYNQMQAVLTILECVDVYENSSNWSSDTKRPDPDTVLRAQNFIMWMCSQFPSIDNEDIRVFPTMSGGINITYNTSIKAFEIQISPETEPVMLSWSTAGKLDFANEFSEVEAKDKLISMLTGNFH